MKRIYIVKEDSLFPDSSYIGAPTAFASKESATDFLARRKEQFKTDLNEYAEDFGNGNGEFTYSQEQSKHDYLPNCIRHTLYGEIEGYKFYTQLDILACDIEDNATSLFISIHESNAPTKHVWELESWETNAHEMECQYNSNMLDAIHNLEKGYWTAEETGIDINNHKVCTLWVNDDREVYEYGKQTNRCDFWGAERLQNFEEIFDIQHEPNADAYIHDTETLYYMAWKYYDVEIKP